MAHAELTGIQLERYAVYVSMRAVLEGRTCALTERQRWGKMGAENARHWPPASLSTKHMSRSTKCSASEMNDDDAQK